MVNTRTCLLLSTMLGACQIDSPEIGSDLPAGSVGAVLTASRSGIQYADLDKPEALPWGPSGFFSIKSGYAVSDNVGGKIVLLDHDFDIVRRIDVRGHARGITAIAPDGDHLVALDAAEIRPRLLRIDAGGAIKAAEIPSDSAFAPSGLRRDDLGLILEYGGGERLHRITERAGQITAEPTTAYVWNGHSYALDAPARNYFHQRTLYIDGRPAIIRVPNHLGAARILGADSDGGVQVLVEDVEIAPVVSVEQTIWHFALSTEVLSVARVPLTERITAVSEGVALDRSGEPVALVPQRGSLQFWRLSPTHPTAILARPAKRLADEGTAPLGTATQGLVVAGSGCLTPAQMQSNALEYLLTSTFISSASIVNDASCPGRIIPAYLGSAGIYSSVSYDWGGFDTPAQFVSAMSAGKKAGNLNSTGSGLSCSYGVDCSGFVSRVWGFSFKLSTTTIPGHAKPYTPILALGDVLNKAGDHVVVFQSNATNGIATFESTHYHSYDRVVNIYRPWSSLIGYQAYRSETNCTP